MGCNFSKEPVKVVEFQDEENPEKLELETADSGKRASVTKSNDSFISSNGSIESDKAAMTSSSDILAPHRSKSVDLSRNGSANRDDPPVATATIIRKPNSSRKPPPRNNLDVPLPHQAEEIPPPSDITLTPPQNGSRANGDRRRRSDGDIGLVTSVTCIPRSLVRSNPLLNSNLPELRIRPPPFGPRNSRLTLTESQKDFFRMLDEKVAQGKDYCSEDERSLASFRSAHRKDSNGSNGIIMTPIPQQVR